MEKKKYFHFLGQKGAIIDLKKYLEAIVMNVIPKFLGLFNYKMKHTSFFGNVPINSGEFSGKDGDWLEIVFNEPTKVNALTMFEKGEKITEFGIYAMLGNEMKMVYRQDRVADFRLCAIDEIVTSRLKIVVTKTRKGSFGDLEIFVYNLPKIKREFRKMAYIVIDGERNVSDESVADYNCFNLIGNWKIDENTIEISCNSEGDKVEKTQKQFDETLEQIKKTVPNPEIVVTLQCERTKYVEIVKNPKTIPAIVEFVDKYNFDGISFDWEYPTGPIQWRLFDKFIIELKKALGEKIVTLALASWIRYGFSEEALKSIAFVELMTYDNMPRDIDGHHSEFFIDGANAVLHMISKGFKAEQIDLGIPFYARPVDGTTYWKDYKDEVDKMDEFTNVVHGDYQDVDGNGKSITVKSRFYNSKQLVDDKTTYAIYSRIAGVMVWHLSADAPHSNPLCLSKTIRKTVEKRTK